MPFKYRIFTGVDGCKAGWFVIRLTNLDAWSFEVCGHVADIWAARTQEQVVLIDIPIGLVGSGNVGRSCDTIARKLLGSPRCFSVFSPPCRAATAEGSYEAASRVNCERTGKRLSAQAFGILPKIAEVDEWIVAEAARSVSTLEVHPELLFWALSGGEPMAHRKKRTAGVKERLQVLERFMPRASDLYTEVSNAFPRSRVARDDILDAMAAAVAGLVAGGDLKRIPEEPEYDEKGLPMQMVLPAEFCSHAF